MRTTNYNKFAVILALATFPLAIYHDTVSTTVAQWSTASSYRHSYLIPVISIFLLWQDRHKIASMSFDGSWAGVAASVILVGVWNVAEATSVDVIEQLSVALMSSAFVLAVVGRSVYRAIWFPLAYLLFSVPAGASIVPPLMDSTATIAVAALRILHVPVVREGMIVSLPGGTFEVVEACSGQKFLNAGIALGVLVAHQLFGKLWKQAAYVASVVGAIILVNGFRAFITMLVASASNMRVMVGQDHVYFGAILFLLTMALVSWVAARYSDTNVGRPSRAGV